MAEVDTAALRKAFEKSGLTKTELARRLRWLSPNIQKLNRALGYTPDCTRGRKRTTARVKTSYGMAVKLCVAMNADPTEIGI